MRFVLLLLALVFALTVNAQIAPDKTYLVYVLSESADKISLVSFGPTGARVVRTLPDRFTKRFESARSGGHIELNAKGQSS